MAVGRLVDKLLESLATGGGTRGGEFSPFTKTVQGIRRLAGDAEFQAMDEGNASALLDAFNPWTALLHSGNAYGGDSDFLQEANAQRQNAPQNSRELNRTAKPMAQENSMGMGGTNEEVDPLAVLQAEISGQASQFTLEALQMGVAGARAAETMRTTPEFQRVAAVSPVDDYYASVVGPYANVISTFPAGQKVSSGGGKDIKQAIDPKTGETIVYQQLSVNHPSVKTYQDDNKVMAATINAAGKTGQEPFNLSESMTKMKSLTGDALLDYVGTTVVNIDMQMAAEQKRIREVAALESGYVSARAAYERNLMLDATSRLPDGRMFSSLGQASAQTLQAKALMDQNFQISERMTEGLLKSDSKIAELHGSRVTLTTMQAQRAQREEREAARREGREDADRNRRLLKEDATEQRNRDLTASVTSQEVANYRTITGSTDDDLTVKLAVLQNKQKGTVTGQVVDATPDNIALKLWHTDKAVSNKALEVFLAFEKAANPDIKPDATTSKMVDLIKKALANPQQLVQFAPQEVQESLRTALRSPQSSKEAREQTRAQLAMATRNFVENQVQGEFLTNMRTWKAGTLNPELQKALDETYASHPRGLAPWSNVLANFMERKMTDPTGKPVLYNARLKIVEEAINNAVPNIPKNMFITPETIDGMRLSILNTAKNESAQYQIRNFSGIYGR